MFSEFYKEEFTATMVLIRHLNAVFVGRKNFLIMGHGNDPLTHILHLIKITTPPNSGLTVLCELAGTNRVY